VDLWSIAEELLRSVNTFVVHNIVDTFLSLAVVSVFLSAHHLRDVDTRIRLFILPIIVPIIALPIVAL